MRAATPRIILTGNLRLPAIAASSRWLPLLPIMVAGLFLRLVYLPIVAYYGDLEHFASWVYTINRDGMLNFYNPIFRFATWDRTYPPLSTLLFGAVRVLYGGAPFPAMGMREPLYVALLKLAPMLCELLLIVAAYVWLNRRPVLRWVIPGLLAIYPGLIATTAWWGQYDATYVLCVVLALVALNRDRPLLAWVFFAVALLFKQPAIVLSPLMLVITFRRYGWRKTLLGIVVSGLVCLAAFAPFMLASGPVPALSPYLNASDVFPYLTNNAWNFWYSLASLNNGKPVHFEDRHYRDALMIFDLLSYKTAGLLMFGLYGLVIMARMWRDAPKRREFVWAAALFFGFFMFPTQVHERYLYPVAILSLLAVSQDWRMLWVALGVAFTYSYNILGVAIPYRDPKNQFGTETLAIPTALLNIALFIETAHLSWKEKAVRVAKPVVAQSHHREGGALVSPKPGQTA